MRRSAMSWTRLSGFFFFKQKTAYEMRISDWSSDVCSSDLRARLRGERAREGRRGAGAEEQPGRDGTRTNGVQTESHREYPVVPHAGTHVPYCVVPAHRPRGPMRSALPEAAAPVPPDTEPVTPPHLQTSTSH